jgi:hypothetical protein
MKGKQIVRQTSMKPAGVHAAMGRERQLALSFRG